MKTKIKRNARRKKNEKKTKNRGQKKKGNGRPKTQKQNGQTCSILACKPILSVFVMPCTVIKGRGGGALHPASLNFDGQRTPSGWSSIAPFILFFLCFLFFYFLLGFYIFPFPLPVALTTFCSSTFCTSSSLLTSAL